MIVHRLVKLVVTLITVTTISILRSTRRKMLRLGIKRMISISVVGLFLMGSVTNQTVYTAIAQLLFQNYTEEGLVVSDTTTVYAYETESELDVNSEAEFDGYTYTAANFETGTDDLDAVSDTNDYLVLNHYGDNEPDTDTNGDWWDDDSDTSTKYNWRYRRCAEIDHTDTDANDVTEYQVYFDVDTATLVTATKMESDGSDIRFADEDGNVLPHYIADDMNEASTRIWVQVDNIDAATTESICMYYGYEGTGSPTSTSDRESVFSYASEKDIYYATADSADGSTAEFVSYADSNAITVGTDTFALDEYEDDAYPATFSAYAQTDTISALGPIALAFNGDGSDTLVPASAAGTEFTYRFDRYTNEFSIVSPWCDTDIEVRNGTGSIVTSGSFTVTAGTGTVFNTTNVTATGIPNNDMAIIESTNSCPFLLTHTGNNIGDTSVLYPATEEWYGVGSGGTHVSILENSTDVTVYKSTGTAVTYTGLNRGDEFEFNDAGSQGSEPAHRVVATKPVGASTLADADGGEMTTFIPVDEMDYVYYLPQDMQYVAISTLTGVSTTVDLYNDGTACGTGTPDSTSTVTPTAPRPGKVYFGTTTSVTNIDAGACIVADNPIAPYYEFHDSNAYSDETNTWGPKQSRQYIYPEPSDTPGTAGTGSWTLGTADTYTSRIDVQIDNNSTTDAIDEYVYRLELDNTNFSDVFTNAQTDGGDIRVAGSTGDGTDDFDYWLEEYDSSGTTAVLWIQLDSIAASSNDTIYLYYNTTSTLTSTGDELTVFSYASLRELFYVVDDHWKGQNIDFISFIDSNQVDDGTFTEDLDEGEMATIPTGLNQDDVFSVTHPLHVGFSGDATDSALPISWAGTAFSGNANRNNDVFSFYAPYADADIEIFSESGGGWNSLTTATITQGTADTVIQDITNGDAFYITSDEPIVAFHRNDNIDSYPLYPVEEALEEDSGSYELYGIATGSLLISATDSGTTSVTVYLHDSATPLSITLDASTDYAYTGAGYGAQGQGTAMHLVSDKPIAAQAVADSDGSESYIFLPQKEMSDTYAVSNDTQYISMAAKDASVECKIYDETGTEVTTGGATMDNVPPQTGGTNTLPRPNFIHIGGNDTTDGAFFTAGYHMECDEPVFAYYEHHLNTAVTDETTWLTWPQVRQRDHAQPVVEDLDAVNEEGLYYESGYDSATTATDPEAYMEIEIDSGSEHTYWHDVEWVTNLGDPETATNSVEPLEVEAAYANSTNCTTATYSAYSSIAVDSLDQFPDEFSDNQCVRLRVYLRTGDEAYSPELLQLLVHYYVPTELEDVLSTPTIAIAGNTSGTDIRQRIIKAETTSTALTNSEAYTTFNSVSDGSVFTTANVELLEIPTQTVNSQFSWPAFPGSRTNASTTSPYDSSDTVAVYFEHDRSAGSTETINLEFNIDVIGAGGPWISHPFALEIGG